MRREGVGAAEAEVAQFDVAQCIHEDVLWLDVSVQHPMHMAVRHRLQQLIAHRLLTQHAEGDRESDMKIYEKGS